MQKMYLESLPIFYWRIENYVLRNMSLWHEDFFELTENEKKQKPEKACFPHPFADTQDINLPGPIFTFSARTQVIPRDSFRPRHPENLRNKSYYRAFRIIIIIWLYTKATSWEDVSHS